MTRRATWIAAIGLLTSSMAWAQDGRVQIRGTAGWTFSDGVSGDARTVPGAGTFNRIDPKDSFSWSARIAFLTSEHLEVGGLFGMQMTSLELGGNVKATLGDENIYHYHSYFAYNFGDEHDRARPYVLGARRDAVRPPCRPASGEQQRNIGGITKFSTTWRSA